MKKNAVMIALLGALALSGVGYTSVQEVVDEVRADAVVPQEGDYEGGAKYSFSGAHTESDAITSIEVNVGGAGNADYSGTGIYIRMKNNTDIETPITFKLNSTNGVIIAPTTNVAQTYFDINGAETTGSNARAWGNYLMLPASFDGYIYMNYTSQMSKIGGADDASFDSAHIWRIYMDINTFYDSYASFTIGDIFTDSKTVLDTSKLTAEQFAATFTAQDTKVDVTQEPKFELAGDLVGGIKFEYGSVDTSLDVGAVTEINIGGSGNADFGGKGLYVRMKNYTGNDTWITWKFNSTNTAIFGPKTGTIQKYFDADGNEMTVTVTPRNWGNYLLLPASFDGFVYFNYKDLAHIEGSDSFAPAGMWRIYFEISKMYDSWAKFAIGDMLTDTHVVFDSSTFDETNLSTWFVKQDTNIAISRLPLDFYQPKGDLKGGIKSTLNGYGGFMIKGPNANIGGDGIYFRIKNNLSSATWAMTHVASDYFGKRVVNANLGAIKRFDANGENPVDATINDVGYFEVPASFDGIIYIPWTSFSDDTGWAAGGLNKANVSALYFEANVYDVIIGDVFTSEAVFYDGSELYESECLACAETWSGSTLAVNEGFKPAPVVLFDYTEVTYAGSKEGGVTITATKNNDQSVFSTASINFATALDLSDGEAVAMNVKLNGNTPFGMKFYDNDSHVANLPAKTAIAVNPIYVIADGSATVVNHTTGDDHTIHNVDGVEGVLVLEKAFMVGDNFDWSNVTKIEIVCHTFYDSALFVTIGDIGVVDQTAKTHTVKFVAAEVTSFADVYKADDEYMHVEKFSSVVPCDRVGDVKVLNHLNYESEEALHSAVIWNEGDNVCSYTTHEDGMKVHVGPWEAGHTYGDYMALKISNDAKKTDYAFYDVNESGEKVFGKGLSVYLKNLSNKEIGINLQFDEFSTPEIEGKTVNCYERWIIKGYPAMYYAYDVNTGAEFSIYSKGDQIQIPVGFEGYVRIPFDQFEVPDWCIPNAGVDQILDLAKFNKEFYLTSNNTKFEDLEFVINDIGVYFNETVAGTRFNSTNSIRANMGLAD